MNTGVVSINGVITPAEEGKISVLDHGFLFGDSIYETMRTYGGTPFLFSRHFTRLEHSAKTILLTLPWTREKMRQEVQKTIAAAGAGEHRVRITITRGTGDVGPDVDSCETPTVVIFATPFKDLPSKVYDEGVEIIVSSYYRSRQLGGAKTGNLLVSVLALRESKTAGAFEAITLTADGKISDGITSNLWLVQGNKLMTPSIASGILEGITRTVVLDLARRAGLQIVEGIFELSEVGESSEMFLTSSTREIVPIVRVADKPVGTGKPGPVFKQLHAAYRQEVDVLLKEA